MEPDWLELLFQVLCEGAEFDKCKVHSFTLHVNTEASFFDMVTKLLRVNKRLATLKLLVADQVVVAQEKFEALQHNTAHRQQHTDFAHFRACLPVRTCGAQYCDIVAKTPEEQD
eukprot:TRINITY_DN940_c0_g1_i3.p1 TRINITY_DN940_c0_g1~~TRINITY_DN940_c0_g1_i3.p1  ORF type:complete len:114 (-),score=20.71 TRINITY_DN940_c0_g1_i3:11-352(-)